MLIEQEKSSDLLSYRQQFSINAFLKPFFRDRDISLEAVVIFGDLIQTEKGDDIYLLLVAREGLPPFMVMNVPNDPELLLTGRMIAVYTNTETFQMAGRHVREIAQTIPMPETGEEKVAAVVLEVKRGYIVWFELRKGFVASVVGQSQEPHAADQTSDRLLGLMNEE